MFLLYWPFRTSTRLCTELPNGQGFLGNLISTYYPNISLGRKEAIFGDINSKGDSVINTLILLAKQFLWRQKFGSKNINELQFILYMRRELIFLAKVMEFVGNKSSFCREWVQIFQYFEIDWLFSSNNWTILSTFTDIPSWKLSLYSTDIQSWIVLYKKQFATFSNFCSCYCYSQLQPWQSISNTNNSV